MKVIYLSTLVVSSLILGGCGSDSGDTTKYSNVSFSVSDAPVDTAESVTIAFSQIELKGDDGLRILLDVTPSDPNKDYEQIDLLDYQGMQSALILSETPIPVGTYKELILYVKPENGLNFVRQDDGINYPLKQPSNKLKLGSFEVQDEAAQAFTIEFELRKSLVERGSNAQNGYILKPHGVTIIGNESASSLTGVIDPQLYTQASGCDQDRSYQSSFVYLYQGTYTDASVLIDLIDPNDESFDDSSNPVPESSISPYASAKVTDANTYEFGYLPPGNYTVAFSCNAENDDSVQYDSLSIPLPTEQFGSVTLGSGVQEQYNFTK